jgi:hypothetical protein
MHPGKSGLCHHAMARSAMRVFITAGRGHHDCKNHLRQQNVAPLPPEDA